METKIEINDANFSYNSTNTVFNNISFSIRTNSKNGLICSLIGPSGSGKSTLLKIIAGIYRFNNGQCNISPNNVVISYLPQSPVIFEHLSPLENAQYFKYSRIWKNRFDENIFQKLLHALDLESIVTKSNKILELSGGEKQRLMLLRSLSINPHILLLDEPLAGIDSDLKHFFLLNLRKIADENHLLIINVTHHSTETNLISDKVLYLLQSENDKVVHEIKTLSYQDFLNKPPDINAAFFNFFPKLNCLPIYIENDNRILINNPGNNLNLSYLILSCSSFSFFGDQGYDYKIIGSNSENIFIELALTNKIVIAKNIHQQIYKGKLTINGKGLLYDSSYMFLNKVEISQNVLIQER